MTESITPLAPKVRDLLGPKPIIPVLVIDKIEDAVPLCEALAEGGLTAVEITLRTPIALDLVAALRKELPDLCIGVGTVLNLSDAKRAEQAGAQFLVSPGIIPDLLSSTDSKLPYLPGVATASEMMAVLASGRTEAKLFPAAAVGGVQLLKAINSPLSALHFCPTGGIDQNTYQDYLPLANVFAVGGSWMAPEYLIADKAWQEITALCRQIGEK